MAITTDIIEQSIVGDKLNLSNKNLSIVDVVTICTYLKKHPEILSLDVRGSYIRDEGAKALATNISLTSLDVSNNQVGAKGAKALAANTRLTSLNLAANQIGDEGAQALAANTSLKSLNVADNQIRDKGARALAANTSLISLSVRHNQIGIEGLKALAANSSLTSLANQRDERLSFEEKSNAISMMLLGEFIAALGITAIAVAFAVLNAATFGAPGVALAWAGVAVTLSGVGLFSVGASEIEYKTPEATANLASAVI